MTYSLTRRRTVIAAMGLAGVAAALAVPRPDGAGAPLGPINRAVNERIFGTAGQVAEESAEARTAAEQYAAARTAPSGVVAPGAYQNAYAQITSLASTADVWDEITDIPYNADAGNYRDPYWSNSSGGAGIVAGRVTGLAVDGATVYAGGADGGVFRATIPSNPATPFNWVPISDSLPSLSTGDLKVNTEDHSLWYATGEGNTGATSYVGMGVYRYASGTWTKVGGNEIDSTMINKLQFEPVTDMVYAATSNGLWKHSSTATSGSWTKVLDLVDPTGSAVTYKDIVNDVLVQPGSGGRIVIANAAWRGGAAYNGMYLSTNFGAAGSWRKVNPTGALNPQDIGNAEFAYSPDGTKLYTVVESITKYTYTPQTVLAGVYTSSRGVGGPWTKIADSGTLAGPSSALHRSPFYHPGVQAWYNNFIAVDPRPGKANHVYLGLEEVYESFNGGKTWTTTGPYWNFGFRCWSIDPTKQSGNCPQTTHPDQHSIAFNGSRVFVGNDGGVYSRAFDGPINRQGNATDWLSHNHTLRTLQYYAVGAGTVAGGVAVWGGLQDNGQSLIRPGLSEMVSPVGGDGGDQIVDPNNGCRAVGEYVYLTMQMTTNCGESDGSTRVIKQIDPGDPNPRFIAPFEADDKNINHWVAGGQWIWKNTKGWDIQDGTEWTPMHGLASGQQTTAIDMSGGGIYAGYCGGGCNPGSSFARGAVTNVQPDGSVGAFRSLALTGVPSRYISGMTIDPADRKHVYLVLNGFSRRWVEGPGAGVGHVYESTDAGTTWTLIDVGPTAGTGDDLPDIPANDLEIVGGRLFLGTDLGVYVREATGSWQRVGSNLPLVTALDLHVGPDTDGTGDAVFAATHSRGIWKVSV